MIFNKSLRAGSFPDGFKMALVTPTHKKGPKSEVINYHPVCLRNVFAKVFERLVHDALSRFLLDKLDDCQHGFVKDKAALTNLTIYVDYLARCLDASSEVYVYVIYTDLAKAFDTVKFLFVN